MLMIKLLARRLSSPRYYYQSHQNCPQISQKVFAAAVVVVVVVSYHPLIAKHHEYHSYLSGFLHIFLWWIEQQFLEHSGVLPAMRVIVLFGLLSLLLQTFVVNFLLAVLLQQMFYQLSHLKIPIPVMLLMFELYL